MYENGEGVKQDYFEAIKWYRQAAEQGHAEAQYKLGSMYANGQGIRQNYEEAFYWLKKAAAQRNGVALGRIGVAYLTGEGVEQDKWKAKDYFGRSCEAGFQLGCDMYRELNNEK